MGILKAITNIVQAIVRAAFFFKCMILKIKYASKKLNQWKTFTGMTVALFGSWSSPKLKWEPGIDSIIFFMLIMESFKLHGFHLITSRLESANTQFMRTWYNGCRTDHMHLREAYGDSISRHEVKSWKS